MHPKKLILIAMSILATSTISCGTLAHDTVMEGSKSSNLELLLDRSRMVFVGRVVEVDYRLSETRSEDEASLPYTIVTYEIDKILHGAPLGETFSMRFLGGSDGRGGFMTASNAPLFQVGDEDLLFVSGNGEDGCPLVLCESGRYRVLGGRIYNSRGVPVQSIDNTQAIARGVPAKEFRSFSYPSPSFDALLENEEVQELVQQMKNAGLSLDDLRSRYEKDAPAQIEVLMHFDEDSARADSGDAGTRLDSQDTADSREWPMAVEQFMVGVSSIAHSKNRTVPDPLESIDPEAPFYASLPLESVAPPGPQAGTAQTAEAQSSEEIAELEALRKQDFNPVIKQ